MKSWGLLDFAGGTVVEINGGVAGLITALFLGKRLGVGYPSLHNLPFVVLGAALLWFGWLGFNAGSALAANAIAVNAFIATNTAGAAAAGRHSTTGNANGDDDDTHQRGHLAKRSTNSHPPTHSSRQSMDRDTTVGVHVQSVGDDDADGNSARSPPVDPRELSYA